MKLKKTIYDKIGEAVYQVKLDNGLQCFFIPKLEYQETFVIMTSYFGSLDTRFQLQDSTSPIAYPAGIAHFLEHKLFEMSDGQDALIKLNELGAEGNAYTTFEQTSYLFSTQGKVEPALDILQEMLSRGFFSKESIIREQEIITQEILMYQDDMDYCLFMETLSQLYPKTPLAEDIAGSQESILEINEISLSDNFSYFYQPQNLSLVVVGNFDLTSVFNSVYDFQKKLPKFENYELKKQELNLKSIIPKREMTTMVVIPKLSLGYRGEDSLNREELLSYRLGLKLFFAMLLGWTSNNYQNWYKEGLIDSSFNIEIEVLSRAHFVIISMDSLKPKEMLRNLKEVIENIELQEDFNREHFVLLRREMLGDFIMGMNSLEFIGTQLAECLIDSQNCFDIPEILEQLTLEQVIKIGSKFLKSAQCTELIFFPK